MRKKVMYNNALNCKKLNNPNILEVGLMSCYSKTQHNRCAKLYGKILTFEIKIISL